ncbi:MAG: hypothetical protein Q9168_002909 [Polycauliona sp. 1 TL-2023]
MPKPSQNSPDFTPKEKLIILRQRKEIAWTDRATTLKLDVIPDLEHAAGPIPFAIIAEAIIAIRGTKDTRLFTAENIATEYTKLRSENNCNYEEMEARLQDLEDATAATKNSTKNTGEGKDSGSTTSGGSKSSAKNFAPSSKSQIQPAARPQGDRTLGEFFVGKRRSMALADPKRKPIVIRREKKP